MWDYILLILIGAAIPLITLRFQSKEKRKYFELERKEKFKMVAIEKRLATHQEAIKHWHLLLSVMHRNNEDEHKLSVIKNAREFWLNTCLYMEKETRKMFSVSINIVSDYTMWLEIGKSLPVGKEKEENTKYFMKQWNDFHRLFEIIQEEVELEPIKPNIDVTPKGEEIKEGNKKKK
ncbi:MAG: hypothetical protein IIC75_00525 [Bacteroidetes bacterium]|nr:hypothetical protein [Bacteroidota bacterium]